jgi:hypothetical protein
MSDRIAWRRCARRLARPFVLVALALACLALLLAGCGDEPSPQDATPSYVVVAASSPSGQETEGVPADFAYYYECLRHGDAAEELFYQIYFHDGRGWIVLFLSDTWKTSFNVAPAEVAAMFRLMSDRGLFTKEWEYHETGDGGSGTNEAGDGGTFVPTPGESEGVIDAEEVTAKADEQVYIVDLDRVNEEHYRWASEFCDAIKGQVPQSAWDEANAALAEAGCDPIP